ncbi:MAG TPA: hypothetical protein DDW52_05935 [Planctomycetaceae bacterium]|nr:hypothetical protein [Planctomycetaceae bacterium]
MTADQLQFAVRGLVIVVAILVVLCFVLAAVYLVIAQRIAARMNAAVREMESILADAAPSRFASYLPGIPPLEIRLAPTAEFESILNPRELSAAQIVQSRLEQLSFRFIGDYVSSYEGEQIRCLLSDDNALLATLRRPAEEEVYLEFCIDLGEDGAAGVANPPSGTIAPTDTTRGRHFSVGLVANPGIVNEMWLAAKDLLDSHKYCEITPESVASFFERSHASEVAYRLESGGVTSQEIEAAFSAHGKVASREDIQVIQQRWQRAIDRHILAETGGRVAARRVLVVHDSSTPEHLLHQLRRMLDISLEEWPEFEEEYGDQLVAMLRLFSPREAMARFRPYLPAELRFEMLTSVDVPIAADLYTLRR